MTDIILRTKGLRKSFGGFVAVDNVDLAVQRGTVHALIGPNGAGKTTLFNLLTRFTDPTAGEIVFNGVDISRHSAEHVATAGMVRSFQISAVFPHFTVRENVVVALQRPLNNSYKFWRSIGVLSSLHERAEAIISDVGLDRHVNTQAADLPYGRKRVLELATTIATDPMLLLLDEPMAGLGQEDISLVSALIKKVARDRSVLMVEHNLSVVADLCQTITVLTRGKVLAQGDYATVSKNPQVLEAYMGTGHA